MLSALIILIAFGWGFLALVIVPSVCQYRAKPFRIRLDKLGRERGPLVQLRRRIPWARKRKFSFSLLSICAGIQHLSFFCSFKKINLNSSDRVIKRQKKRVPFGFVDHRNSLFG